MLRKKSYPQLICLPGGTGIPFQVGAINALPKNDRSSQGGDPSLAHPILDVSRPNVPTGGSHGIRAGVQAMDDFFCICLGIAIGILFALAPQASKNNIPETPPCRIQDPLILMEPDSALLASPNSL